MRNLRNTTRKDFQLRRQRKVKTKVTIGKTRPFKMMRSSDPLPTLEEARLSVVKLHDSM